MTLTIISVFLSITYTAIMLAYLHGWRSLPEWCIPEGWEPTMRVSVIVPARNEAVHIEACLQSILAGTYPANLLEIIVVDDFSTDGTAAVVRQFVSQNPMFRIRLRSLADFVTDGTAVFSPKKKALEVGIAHATGEIVVTTDADCVVPENWLKLVVSRFNPTPGPSPIGRRVRDVVAEHSTSPLLLGEGPGVGLVTAPVAFHREHNLLQRFQSLDFLGLMGITGAGIQLGWQHMGNGANLAYTKAVFEKVGGFSGNENRASGDDMFLIQKVAGCWPGSVFFLKNPAATVLTEAKSGVRAFLQQRLRWGTKNAALAEWPVRLVLLTVFLFCWSILTNSVLAVVGVFAGNFFPMKTLFFQLAVKMAFDYVFLRELCRYFGRADLLRWFVPSFLLHTLYIPLVGAASLFVKKYDWKGRRLE